MSQAFTDSSGRAILQVQSQGGYIVKVTGPGIRRRRFQSHSRFSNALTTACARFSCAVKASAAAGESTTTQSAGKSSKASVTSAAELRVPQNARKTYDQGLAAWQKGDYQQAAEKFEKAVAEYPEYDTAYNNLGVMYAHLGQNDQALAAFRRSVELNDKNADADRNLRAHADAAEGLSSGRGVTEEVAPVDPTEVATLTMLVMAEIQDGKPDDALRACRRCTRCRTTDMRGSLHRRGVLEEKHQNAEACRRVQPVLERSSKWPCGRAGEERPGNGSPIRALPPAQNAIAINVSSSDAC